MVYSKIDGIKVTPQAGMARLGGAAFPIRPEQFEARGVQPRTRRASRATPDDLDLGPVDARWSLEEYTATFKDDDLKFVGELGPGRSLHAERRRPEPQTFGQSQQRRRRLGRRLVHAGRR